MNNPTFVLGETLYQNSFLSEKDLKGFRLEGEAKFSFPNGRLRMQNALDEGLGQKSNFVMWCPEDFPDQVCYSWDFWPIQEPGLCMFFFSANGAEGKDLFDSSLKPRIGIYEQYHHSDINTYHLSYFRRKHPHERAFNTCNLRKSFGFHLVSQGGDPIPTVSDALPPYHLTLWKYGPRIVFSIRHQDEEIKVIDWNDDGKTYGELLGEGKCGFRQMAPLIGEYANFVVRKISKSTQE